MWKAPKRFENKTNIPAPKERDPEVPKQEIVSVKRAEDLKNKPELPLWYFEYTGEKADVFFKDGAQLTIIPIKNGAVIEGFESAVLRFKGIPEAAIFDEHSKEKSSWYSERKRGFWSRGKISQQRLADYWNAAVLAGDVACEDRSFGRMSRDAWNKKFWILWAVTRVGGNSRAMLNEGKVNVLDSLSGVSF